MYNRSYLQHIINRINEPKSSSPKFQVFNNALMCASKDTTFANSKKEGDVWGRFVESAVGAHLINSFATTIENVFYWRERGNEVDFVISNGRKLIGIEVKSGRRKENTKGMNEFKKNFAPDKMLLVGGEGMPLEEFLSKDPQTLFL